MPTPAQEPKSHPDLPDEFKQLVSRGYIPAIDDPQFVGASEAEIDDEGWVLGVVLDGQAKAYSLNLLNRHEVVNDRFGDRPVAAVW
jgi:carotenoid cleavage dioxygenase-like enzyme